MREVNEPVSQIRFQCERSDAHARREQEEERPQRQQRPWQVVVLPATHVEVRGRAVLEETHPPPTIFKTIHNGHCP